MHEALDLGITTFDTADVYAGTKAETVLGEALKGGRRESYELFTKVYWPTGPGRNDRGLSRKHIRESCEGSLRRLRTDTIDLYQAHRFDVETPLEETLRAFDDLVRAGKVHYIGVSEWTADQIRDALRIAERDRPGPDRSLAAAVQRALAGHRGRGAAAVQGGGHRPDRVVADRAGRAHRQVPAGPAGARGLPRDGRDRRHVRPALLRDEVLERVQQLRPLADEAGLTMAGLAVAWVLQEPGVSAAIVGASRPEQLKDSVAAAGVRLDPALKARMDEVLGGVAEHDPAKTQSPPQRP